MSEDKEVIRKALLNSLKLRLEKIDNIDEQLQELEEEDEPKGK